MKVRIISFQNNILHWETDLAARLHAAGHDVQIDYSEAGPPATFLKAVLALERQRTGVVARPASFLARSFSSEDPDLIIDLTGKAESNAAPVLTVEISGSRYLAEGLLRLRSSGGPIDLLARCNGRLVGHAAPMIGDRVWLSRDVKELLTSVQSLLLQCLARAQAGVLNEVAELPPAERSDQRPALVYVTRLIGGLVTRALKKMTPGSREFYWRTGYRFIDGPGIAECQRSEEAAFTFLEDDGQCFYADPFPIEHEGRHYLFVEEYSYARGQGVISVAELDADGRFGRPQIVLEEAHHLSYPNVFVHEGQIFMIPEGSAANEVILYRADPFPYRWRREAVLIEGRSFADATLLDHGGRLWMFGTERFGGGNASDTMMVYSAERLCGPWTPHPLNPVTVDRAGARPGGRIVEVNGRLFLPVQNGTDVYGGGLGLREILHLSISDIRLGVTEPILDAGSKGPASLHTLNRVGRLEVIDQLAE